MAGTLTFPIDDKFKSIIAHAMAAPSRPDFYGTPLTEPTVFLVKDHGVYIMACATEPQFANPGVNENRLVAYSQEVDPNTMEFDDWYNRQIEICGGDDFGEPIDAKTFADAIAEGATVIKIKLTADSFAVSSI